MKTKNLKLKINASGFTLIELLVVIVIIGVLSTLLMANFIGIRQRARDGQRKANLRQIQSALELYRADLGGYPTTPNFPACNTAFTGGAPPVTYMSKVPCDPLGGNYVYASDATTYSVVTCLENSSDIEKDASVHTLCTGSGKTNISYTLRNP